MTPTLVTYDQLCEETSDKARNNMCYFVVLLR